MSEELKALFDLLGTAEGDIKTLVIIYFCKQMTVYVIGYSVLFYAIAKVVSLIKWLVGIYSHAGKVLTAAGFDPNEVMDDNYFKQRYHRFVEKMGEK